MKKIFITLMFVFLISLAFASAHGEETFAQAEEIIKQKISCDELTDEQLEMLGDYYMEQMHPGESHEIMDEMMGGEGSENLKQMHINMGLSFYCGEHETTSGDMMDTMMGRGMVGTGYSGYSLFGFLFMVILIVLLVLFIVWLTKEIQKPQKRRPRKRKK